MIQIHDAKTGEDIVREMNNAEFAEFQSQTPQPDSLPTKEQLMAEIAALTAKIYALD
jgi:hypothetical protein